MLDVVFRNPWVRALALLFALILAVALVVLLRPVLVPLFFAFLVAYVLHPMVTLLARRKVPRPLSVAGIGVVAVVLLVSIPLFAVPSIVHEAENLIDASKAGGPGLSGWMEWVEKRVPVEDMMKTLGWVAADEKDVNVREVLATRIGEFLQNNVNRVTEAGQKALWSVASTVASVGKTGASVLFFLGNLAVFAFVAGYLLMDFDNLLVEARKLVPLKWRPKVLEIAGKIDHQLRSFLRGQLLVCLGLAVMYAIGLILSGVPFALFLAVFGGFASIVPYLGLALTIGPAILLALLDHGLDWHVGGVVATFVIAQMIEGTLLTPKIVGDSVGLNPVWVILAIMVFSSAFGFLGLLMAVPLAAALKVLVLEGLDYYRSSPLYLGASTGASSSPSSDS